MKSIQGMDSQPEWFSARQKPLKPLSSLGEESGTESETDESLLERWCEGTGGLRVFKTIELLVVLSAVCLIVIDLVLIFLGVPTFKARCLRIFGVLLGVMMVFIELEARVFMSQVRILENWFMRGVFYAFVGFYSIDIDIDESVTGIMQGTVAACVVGCGLLYTLMGLTCQKNVKELMIVEYKMVKRGLLDSPHKRPLNSIYTPFSQQPPR